MYLKRDTHMYMYASQARYIHKAHIHKAHVSRVYLYLKRDTWSSHTVFMRLVALSFIPPGGIEPSKNKKINPHMSAVD
jgi:hypothetical protein